MMQNNKTTFRELITKAIYKIPEFQRGFTWDRQQTDDLITDIINIINKRTTKHQNHFMGNIVSFDTGKTEKYQRTPYPVFEIVDGQQRLISTSLFLSTVIKQLTTSTENTEELDNYNNIFQNLLHCGGISRIQLFDPNDNELYQKLLNEGNNLTHAPTTPTQEKLIQAYNNFAATAKTQERNNLIELYDILTSYLNFTLYEINNYDEIGMTFELVNNRGKKLTDFELLKNYLLYWSYCNKNEIESNELSHRINSTWNSVFTNLNLHSNDEIGTLLESTYILLSNKTTYKGYNGFKKLLPLIPADTEITTKNITTLLNLLNDLSYHYKITTAKTITTKDNEIIKQKLKNYAVIEHKLLDKIRHTGYTNNFIPIILTCRKMMWEDKLDIPTYFDILKAIELFIYRFYMNRIWKRSDCGKITFYELAQNVYNNKTTPNTIISTIKNLCKKENSAFISTIENTKDWYFECAYNNLLKYTLYEYEEYLMMQRNHSTALMRPWAQLTASTSIEHILPQYPEHTYWTNLWSDENINKYLNNIGNLVLVIPRDNSSYGNHPYPRKCRGEDENGNKIYENYYANSSIMQESEIANYHDWSPNECECRRKNIISFILQRWDYMQLP